VSGAVVGAIVYKALNIWLVSQTDLSKLVLGGVIVLIVVAFPKASSACCRRSAIAADPNRRSRRSSHPGSRPPNEHGATLLSVEGLTKSYGGVHAVRGVSFSLRAGESWR